MPAPWAPRILVPRSHPTATIVDRLKELSFFANIPDHDLRQIAEIMVEKSYRKGAVIIEERTEAERFFIIFRGKIEITKRFESDEEFTLSVQSDGDFFGEMALLDEQPRSATARALEPTIVLETSRKNFETLLYKAPMLAYRIMRELSSRLRETGALLVSHLQQRNRQLYRSYIDTIAIVVQAIDRRGPNVGGHSRRVASLSKAIGRSMGLADEQLMVLELSAHLHDLGMLAVPESVLQKPGPLDERDYETIRKHPRIGREMIEDIPFLEKVIPNVLHHHERFDGTGYPGGIAGTRIPLASRILAVVDAFEAIMGGKPHHDPSSVERAIEEIRRGAGTQFDPDIVAALEKVQSARGLSRDAD